MITTRLMPALLLLAGCLNTQPPSTPAPVTRDFYVRTDPARVWTALLLIYTDLSIPVENMDRASWFLRSQELPIPRDSANVLADCGMEFGRPRAAEPYVDVFLRVTTLLRQEGESTAVRINTQLRGWDRLDAQSNRYANVACVSRGQIEARISQMVRGRT